MTQVTRIVWRLAWASPIIGTQWAAARRSLGCRPRVPAPAVSTSRTDRSLSDCPANRPGIYTCIPATTPHLSTVLLSVEEALCFPMVDARPTVERAPPRRGDFLTLASEWV